MPKVVGIDSKTGVPTGSIEHGRHIKAKTLPEPSAFKAPVAEEGQTNKEVGTSPEAKPLDPKYEALAKKESAIRALEREVKAQQSAMDAKIKAAVDAALSQYRGRLKEAPLDVLNEEGLTYDQLVEQAVNAPDPETRAIKQELKALREAQLKQTEDSQNSAKAQRESAITQIRNDAADLIESDPTFEVIKATESVEDVVDLITRTFDETGKLLTVEKAAQMVEEELHAEAIRIANISKVKAKLTPATVEQSKQQDNKQQQKPMTLTNNMTSTRPMSARERAIAAFKGEKF